jgi:hypothetical protein
MIVKRSIKLKLITTADFDAYFRLDSPGYFIARDAVKAGEATEAVDVLEVLVLTNKLYEVECRKRIAAALEPYGRDEQYLALLGTEAAHDLLIETLGNERVEQILRDAVQDVKRQSRVGTGENDTAVPSGAEGAIPQ